METAQAIIIPKEREVIGKKIQTAFNRLLKKASTALITQIRKNDYTDISMGFNL